MVKGQSESESGESGEVEVVKTPVDNDINNMFLITNKVINLASWP
jgi:hypothetical protein